MLESTIYVKTDAGRDEIRSRTLGLSMAVRAILLMVDGQRSVASMRTLIAGSKAPADVLDTLAGQGLIEPRADTVIPPPPALPPAAPTPAPSLAAEPVAPVALPIQPAFVEPAAKVSDDTIAAAMRTLASTSASAEADLPIYDAPLDLVLETIGPEPALQSTPPQPQPQPAMTSTDLGGQAANAPLNRYEQLYASMNEIVRDFLVPHRRFFFQLKIERCGTAEELLELLHDLQTALGKSRGEAFASDVIARLRAAAG